MLIRAQLGRSAFQHELSVAEDVAAICDREREMDVLLDEQHARTAVVDDLAQDLQQVLDDDRRQAEAHLVDHQELRSRRERACHRQHLLLSTGEQACPSILDLGQRWKVVQDPGAPRPTGSRPGRRRLLSPRPPLCSARYRVVSRRRP